MINLINKLPGPLLIFFGAFSLSFGGLIVKSFEGANLWQILFWRSIFFILVVSIFLILSRLISKKGKIPFGPYLSISAYIIGIIGSDKIAILLRDI